MAETFIKAGWYFGFGGTSTFKNDHGVREILRKMPLDRIVLKQIRLIWPLFLTAGNAITRFM